MRLQSPCPPGGTNKAMSFCEKKHARLQTLDHTVYGVGGCPPDVFFRSNTFPICHDRLGFACLPAPSSQWSADFFFSLQFSKFFFLAVIHAFSQKNFHKCYKIVQFYTIPNLSRQRTLDINQKLGVILVVTQMLLSRYLNNFQLVT